MENDHDSPVELFGWKHVGKQRPSFAIPPGPGQISCWDFPRPPAIEKDNRLITVSQKAEPLVVIAESRAAIMIKETAAPPCFYIPQNDVNTVLLEKVFDSSFCEWKGHATYYSLKTDPSKTPIGWVYHTPNPKYEAIKDAFAFYAGKSNCTVDGEVVIPQPSDFYGGWATKEVVGPFKGAPETLAERW